MPRTARSYDSAFASDAESGQKKKKEATSICELSSYEKLNSGQTDQGEGTGKSDASSGTSSSPSSSSSSDASATDAPSPDKNKNRLSIGGAGRHTKRLVDMKTAAAVAAVNRSDTRSVGVKKVTAAASSTSAKAAAKSMAKKAKGNGSRRSANGNIGSAQKKGSTEKKAKKPAAVAAATKKRKKQSASNANGKSNTKSKDEPAAAKPLASVAMPGRLVRISDYRRQMEPSPISSPIHRVNLTFTPEAMEAADEKQRQKKDEKTTDTAMGPSKKRSAAMVSGGTGRFNIKQE